MRQEVQHFAEYLLEGNQLAAYEIVMSISEQSDICIYEQVLTEAMRYVGMLWENNRISVADEHLATSVCDFVLSQYAFYRRKAERKERRPKVMLLCVEGEQHYLGIKMVHSLFEEYGWDARFLGANLPMEAALSQASQWKPNVVCLSFTLINRLQDITNYARAFEGLEHKTTVMIGGRLVKHYDLRRYCSDRTILVPGLGDFRQWLMQRKDHSSIYDVI
ncbi:cobalamin B12-binding domain-containing protein [Aneurinibacillus sp. REN35]|uniref:cobalamin B12-binding domain-containing protein n=1 Tax=Aneurinibacillus sp. REN35 TaxID=3237286 RepID=UPI003528E20C